MLLYLSHSTWKVVHAFYPVFYILMGRAHLELANSFYKAISGDDFI